VDEDLAVGDEDEEDSEEEEWAGFHNS